MLLDAPRSLLLAIDLQEKMLPAIADHDGVLRNCEWLIRAAQKIGVPVVAIEQYPKGLGPLVPSIRETSDAGTPIVAKEPNSPEAQAFLALAHRVREKLAATGDARPAPKIIVE